MRLVRAATPLHVEQKGKLGKAVKSTDVTPKGAVSGGGRRCGAPRFSRNKKRTRTGSPMGVAKNCLNQHFYIVFTPT